LENAQNQVKWLFANPTIAISKCTLCTASLQIAKFLSLAAPEQTPPFFVFLCQQFKLSSSCNSTFSATTLGSVLTQVVANANISGYDGQVRAVTLEPLHSVFDGKRLLSVFPLADLPELRPEHLSASTYAPSEPHRLVFQAKT
jgi:hypothetical protein